MRSRTPKVLHRLAGRPMIDLVLTACRTAGVQDLTVVISPQHEAVAGHLDQRCTVVFQAQLLGTEPMPGTFQAL